MRRSLTLPIAGPVEGTWQDLGAALRVQWDAHTRAATWLVRELYARDVRREPGDTRLRPMPVWYAYPEARERFPEIAPINLTALVTSVTATYRRQRYELLWTGWRQLATFRYPVPAVINEQAWAVERTPGGAWIVAVRLGDAWWRLRLRGGRDYAIHLRRLEQLASGAAIRGAASLRRLVAHTGDHRSGSSRDVRVLLTIAGYFPRPAPRSTALEWRVETSQSDLLLARQHGQGVVWRHPGDAIRGRAVAHRLQDHRDAQTLSVVRRWVPAERRALAERRQQRATRYARAMRTQLQQVAAALAAAAREAGVGVIRYSDSADTFGPLPWHGLRQCLQSACEARGLRWIYEEAPVADEAPLATTG